MASGDEGRFAPFYNTTSDVVEALGITKASADSIDGNDADAIKKWGPAAFYTSIEAAEGSSATRREWPDDRITGDAMMKITRAAQSVNVLKQVRLRIHPRLAGSILCSNILPSIFCLSVLPASARGPEAAFLAASENWSSDALTDDGIKKNRACFVAYLNMVFKSGFDPESMETLAPGNLLHLALIGNIVAGAVLSSGVDKVDDLTTNSPKMANFLLQLYVQIRGWLRAGLDVLASDGNTKALMQALVSAVRKSDGIDSAFKAIIASAGAFRVIQNNPLIGPATIIPTEDWPAYVTWFPEFTTGSVDGSGKEGLLVMDPDITATENDEADTSASVCVSSLAQVLTSGVASAVSDSFATHTAGLSTGAKDNKAQACITIAKVMKHPDLTTNLGSVVVSLATHNLLTRAVASLSTDPPSRVKRLFELERASIDPFLGQKVLDAVTPDDADIEKVTAALLCVAYAAPEAAGAKRLDDAVVARLCTQGGAMWTNAATVAENGVLQGFVNRQQTLEMLQAVDEASDTPLPDSIAPWLAASGLLPPSEHATVPKKMEDVRSMFTKQRRAGAMQASVTTDSPFFAKITTSTPGREVVVPCVPEKKDDNPDSDSDSDDDVPADGRRVAVPFFLLPAHGNWAQVTVTKRGNRAPFAHFVLDDASMCPYSGTVVGTVPSTGDPVVAHFEVLRAHQPGPLLHKDDVEEETARFDLEVLGPVSNKASVTYASFVDARKIAGASGTLVRLVVESPRA